MNEHLKYASICKYIPLCKGMQLIFFINAKADERRTKDVVLNLPITLLKSKQYIITQGNFSLFQEHENIKGRGLKIFLNKHGLGPGVPHLSSSLSSTWHC
jgi:hypothetical protein